MTSTGDPAERLHTLLVGFTQVASHQVKNEDAWRRVLGVESEDRWALMEPIGAAMLLPGQIVQALQALDSVKADVHVESWLPGVSKFFDESTRNLHAASNSAASHISQAVRTALPFVSTMLAQAPLPAADRDHRARLQEELDALADEVRQADDLPPNLRTFMLRSIAEMTRALDLWLVEGPDGLKRAADRGLGGVLFEWREDTSTESRGIVERFMWHCGRVRDAGVASAEAIEAGEKIVKALGGLM